MTQTRSNRIRIYPTPEQETILVQRMGASRFVWNWCLECWDREYKAGNKPTAYKVASLFRKAQPEWFYAMDSQSPSLVAGNLGAAFKAMFRKQNRYPKFKKKSGEDTYQTQARAIKVEGNMLRIPKCPLIRMSRPLFDSGKLVGNVTIRRTAGRWYVSIPVEIQAKPTSESQAVVGIDLGISTFATLSTGEKVENPKHLKEATRRLAIRQRRLSKKMQGGSNYGKCKAIVARTHATVSNRRKGFLHMLTSDLANRFGAVAIEDLNVAGMVKNRCVARSISDASFGEFRRQLEYKMAGRVLVVDRFFPSSKTCSTCGDIIDKLPLSVREWACPSCGDNHDRDHNAAINIYVRATRPEFTPTSAQADMTGASRDSQSGNQLGATPTDSEAKTSA
jgi:putative transposase